MYNYTVTKNKLNIGINYMASAVSNFVIYNSEKRIGDLLQSPRTHWEAFEGSGNILKREVAAELYRTEVTQFKPLLINDQSVYVSFSRVVGKDGSGSFTKELIGKTAQISYKGVEISCKVFEVKQELEKIFQETFQ